MKNKTTILVVLAVALALFSGCGPKQIAARYFDNVLANPSSQSLGGISGREVRSYEVVQSSGDLVVVRVTFASVAGHDIVRTKKFRVVGTVLKPVEPADVREQIERNLYRIANAVGQARMEREAVPLPDKITYDWLVSTKRLDPQVIYPVADEKYNDFELADDPNKPADFIVRIKYQYEIYESRWL